MMNTTLVARFQQFWGRRIAIPEGRAPTQPAVSQVAPAVMTLTVTQVDPLRQIRSLQVKGVLDRRTTEALMAGAAPLYSQGCRRLIVDLSATTQMDLAGRFVLHRADEALMTNLDERVKLVALPPQAMVIRQTMFCRYLPIYPTLTSASAAFRPLS